MATAGYLIVFAGLLLVSWFTAFVLVVANLISDKTALLFIRYSMIVVAGLSVVSIIYRTLL